jgi:hypothetical protein
MRNKIIKFITDANGKLHHFCLNKMWWSKQSAEYLYYQVFELTNFLPEDSLFRERLFYIQNGWSELQKCPMCKSNGLQFYKNTLKFAPTCKQKQCQNNRKSEISGTVNKNLSESVKKIKAEKCRIANSKSFEERFGKERSDEIKKKLQTRLLGTKQSPATIEKRALAHKGKKLSNETKLKISLTNKKTHNSAEYRASRMEIDIAVGKKLSIIMKQKIQSGEFTPNITNSWTRKNIELLIGGISVKFRSSWDAAFAVLNPTCQYEKIRIPYMINGVYKTYIVDFADFENNILYEIKPDSMKLADVCRIKESAAINWATENNWKYKMINNNWFIDNIKELIAINFPYIHLLKKGLGI